MVYRQITLVVSDFPRPRNLNELRRFLGKCSYYWKFVPNFSKIVSPLQSLNRKDVPFVWSKECEESFRMLKEKLTSAPLLSYPSFEKPFVLMPVSRSCGDADARRWSTASSGLHQSFSDHATTRLRSWKCLRLCRLSPISFPISTAITSLFSKIIAQSKQFCRPQIQHARWWTKVYDSGVKIQYRLNSSAVALSRSPQSPSVAVGANHNTAHVATVMRVQQILLLYSMQTPKPMHQRASLMSSAMTQTYLRYLTSYRRNNFPKKRNEPERLRHFSPF